jgi:hypothetical protein
MGFAVLESTQSVEKAALLVLGRINAGRHAIQPHPHPSPPLEGEGAKPARERYGKLK